MFPNYFKFIGSTTWISNKLWTTRTMLTIWTNAWQCLDLRQVKLHFCMQGQQWTVPELWQTRNKRLNNFVDLRIPYIRLIILWTPENPYPSNNWLHMSPARYHKHQQCYPAPRPYKNLYNCQHPKTKTTYSKNKTKYLITASIFIFTIRGKRCTSLWNDKPWWISVCSTLKCYLCLTLPRTTHS